MKKRLYYLAIFAIISNLSFAQLGYSPVVDSLIGLITEQTITDLEVQLIGDVPVIVNGEEHTIASRYANSPTNPIAAAWIYEQFEDMGLQVEYQYFGSKGENVIATLPGTLFPDQQYIICAHYDDMPSQNFAPGADDNASGVVAVLEAARLLNGMSPLYTVKFIAFDEEELGLIGSWEYADDAASQGDDILGVLNLDMIAYDSNNDNMMSISVNTASTPFADYFISAMEIYEPEMSYNFISTTASDHYPFWANGYKAILAIEDWNDFHAYYHTIYDNFANLNIPYFHKMTRVAVATISSLALDYTMEFDHDPILSSPDTDDRIAEITISSNHPIAGGENAPKCYFSINGGPYNMLDAFEQNGDLYRFMIPGQAVGTAVSYYFAAQDEEAAFIATHPSGGSGMNPPGTNSPEISFEYFVGELFTQTYCSQALPKDILDFQNTYDTITVDLEGAVVTDINVKFGASHPYDGDLSIFLEGTNGTEITLSAGNGGSGNNYINTVFDDDASTSIMNGNPPFTGSFKPEEPLSAMNGSSLSGDWILRVYDDGDGDEGVLAQYCIEVEYYLQPVGTEEIQAPLQVLYQNYPNPFSDVTVIGFELAGPTFVNLELFDMTGRKINTLTAKNYNAGNHHVEVYAGDLPAGRYFYRMQTNRDVTVKSMSVIK